MTPLLLLSAALAAPGGASSIGLNADPWRPALDGDGVTVESAGRAEAPRAELSLLWTHNALLSWTATPDGDIARSALLQDLLSAHLSASQPWGPLRFGLDAPLLFLARGELGDGQIMAGDPQFSLKATALDGGVGLGGQLAVSAPLGAERRSLGEPALSSEATLLLDAAIARAQLGLNLGFRLLPDVDFAAGSRERTRGDQLVAALGAQIPIRAMIASVELRGATSVNAPLDAASTPLEALLGLSQPKAGARLRGAVGVGLLPGLGAPALRVMIGAGAQAVAPPQDDPAPAVQP